MQNNQSTEIMAPPAASLPTTKVTYFTPDDEEGKHLRDYWRILVKRKWWFFSVLSAILGITLLIIFFMPPIYKVTVTLQIIQDKPSSILAGSASDPLGAITGSSEIDRFYETQYNILQSRTMAYGIMDALNLKDHPSYKEMEKDNTDLPADVIRQKYADNLLDHMKVDPIKNSFLVNISYQSTYTDLALKIPQAMQREYLQVCMTTRRQSYSMLQEWLEGELARHGKRLEISEQAVYTNGQKTDFLSMEDNNYLQLNVIVVKYIDVSKLLTNAQAERANKEAQYKQILEKGVDAPLITGNSLISSLRNQLIDMQTQVSGTSSTFGSNYPELKAQTSKMKELEQRLAQEIKRIQTSIKSDYEASVGAENLLRQEYEQAKARVIEMQNGLVEHHILKRDLHTNMALYDGLLARVKDASIASTMVSSNVSVVSAAEMPYKPWIPKPLLFLAIATVLGSLFGAGAAFFIEYLDSSLKSTEELEKLCGIPALGVIPLADSKDTGDQRNLLGLISYTKPTSMVSEAYFHVRSSIMLSASEGPPQVITVTSPNPSEGKTVTSSNIAVTLAGTGRKCVILDCDLRKPKVHQTLGESNGKGLTNHLTGNATLAEVVRPSSVPNLYFISAGPTPPNPNDLLNSSSFERLLQQLREEYDNIILDSPPVIGFADARSLGSKGDGVVLVFRHHSTTREAARLTVQLMSQYNCRILGAVLSMARKDLMGYGGYYQYYHYYHKQYKGYHDAATESQQESGALKK